MLIPRDLLRGGLTQPRRTAALVPCTATTDLTAAWCRGIHLLQARACEGQTSNKMPVTFGAVGDIISLCVLIKDLVKCLDECRGSSAQYQAVIHELSSLEKALLEVEKLFRSCEHPVELHTLAIAVKECVAYCRKSITDFKLRMEKFKVLARGSLDSVVKKTAFRFLWQVSEKHDLAKFREEIKAQCAFINMMLTAISV